MIKNFIKLENCSYLQNKIVYHFTSDLDVFKTSTLFIEYPVPLPEKIESILSIPFVALMAPLGWLTGADLLVPEIDENYANSLQAIQHIYQQWYPHWSFGSEIKGKRQKNTFTTLRKGLLFSLGADSLASFTHHAAENPILFTVLGIEAPLVGSRESYWKKFEQKVEDFKKKHEVEGIFIKTNISRVIDNKKVLYLANWQSRNVEWWGPIAHGLCLTALTAPISYSYLKCLYIASTYNRPEIWGSTRQTDNVIFWGETQVHHDNDTLDRVEKIKHQICPRPDIYPYLKVCPVQYHTLNCSNCEKCIETIICLFANNIDPLECGFPVTSQTLKYIKRRLLYDMFFVPHEIHYRSLMTLRDEVDLTTLLDRHGSLEFFQWFKTASFKDKKNILLTICARLSWLCQYKYNNNQLITRIYKFFQRAYQFYIHKILFKI